MVNEAKRLLREYVVIVRLLVGSQKEMGVKHPVALVSGHHEPP